MKPLIRVCLFFEEKNLSHALRDFFLRQLNCVITDFFTDNNSFVRDITASHPNLVIIQFLLIEAEERKKLQKIFPNTVIATWADSKLDQDKFDNLFNVATALPQDSFVVDHDVLVCEEATTALKAKKYLLTNRELEVLQLLAQGKSHQSVCDDLNISYETIRTHVQHIYAKLKVKRISEAVTKAMREKIVK